MIACPSCGQQNPDGFRLCGMCGASLAVESASPREIRKTVTVVFADVTSSTELAGRLDPEAVRRVMGRYFEAMQGALEQHGGTVEKFIGDAVMAVFGIPVVHEDDALRAVRAASLMRESLAGVNAELHQELGVELEMRIGVNTGEVVAGDPAQGQAFASGDALNVAARLEQAALPGETLLGETTFLLVRDAVDVEVRGPVQAKGKEDGLAAYRLLAVSPDAPGRARRLDSAPMVGRGTELRRLRAAFEQAREDHSCQLFTVLGAAGVGKSRLAEEFLGGAGAVQVLRGRCLAYGEGITFWPLAEALKQAAGLDDSEPVDEARAKLAALAGGEESADVIAHYTSELLGLAEGETSMEEGFWAVRKLVEALARSRPLVLLFDDLHWAEPTFFDLLEYLADWVREAPVLLLCLARPELLDARPGWAGGKLNATSVLLEPLSRDECELLADRLLADAELDENVRSRVAQAADGNPLFVEELVAKLVEDGLVQRRDGHWEATRELGDLDVPPTVTALLTARLDGLLPVEREVVEAAAIEGTVFHSGSVAALTPEAHRGQVAGQLMRLVRKELVRPERPAFADEDAFRFRHVLIRDVAYEALTMARRADLHERFAMWLERRAGHRLAEYAELVGFHLEQAYRYLDQLGLAQSRTDLARTAAGHLLDSGRRAATRGDLPAAINLLERAAALLPPDDPTGIDAQLELSTALISSGALSRADEILSAALAAARSIGDERLQAHAQLRRLQHEFQAAAEQDDQHGRARAEELVRVFERLDDATGLARGWQELGKVLMWTGRCEESVSALEQAIVWAERAGAAMERQRAVGWLPWPLISGPVAADEALRRCRELVRTYGENTEEPSFVPEAMLLAMLGRIDEARDHVVAGRALLHERGMLLTWGGTSMVAAFAELHAGDPTAADRAAREGYDVLCRMGEKGFLSTVAGYRAEAVFLRGRMDEALELCDVAAESAGQWDLEAQSYWRETRARVLARRGEADEAERLARESVQLLAPTDYVLRRADAQYALAEVLLVLGRSGEARPVLEESLALYERKGDVVYAKRARAALADLS